MFNLEAEGSLSCWIDFPEDAKRLGLSNRGAYIKLYSRVIHFHKVQGVILRSSHEPQPTDRAVKGDAAFVAERFLKDQLPRIKSHFSVDQHLSEHDAMVFISAARKEGRGSIQHNSSILTQLRAPFANLGQQFSQYLVDFARTMDSAITQSDGIQCRWMSYKYWEDSLRRHCEAAKSTALLCSTKHVPSSHGFLLKGNGLVDLTLQRLAILRSAAGIADQLTVKILNERSPGKFIGENAHECWRVLSQEETEAEEKARRLAADRQASLERVWILREEICTSRAQFLLSKLFYSRGATVFHWQHGQHKSAKYLLQLKQGKQSTRSPCFADPAELLMWAAQAWINLPVNQRRYFFNVKARKHTVHPLIQFDGDEEEVEQEQEKEEEKEEEQEVEESSSDEAEVQPIRRKRSKKKITKQQQKRPRRSMRRK